MRTQVAPDGQKKAQEIILDMENIFYDILMEYKNRNGYFPKRIVYFRDGVSEGQFKPVRIRISALYNISLHGKKILIFFLI